MLSKWEWSEARSNLKQSAVASVKLIANVKPSNA